MKMTKIEEQRLDAERKEQERQQLDSEQYQERQRQERQQYDDQQRQQQQYQEQQQLERQQFEQQQFQQQQQFQEQQRQQQLQADRLWQQKIAANARDNRTEQNQQAVVEHTPETLQAEKTILTGGRGVAQDQEPNRWQRDVAADAGELRREAGGINRNQHGRVEQSDTLNQYRQHGLVSGVENTFGTGRDGSEQITINEREFQQRQAQLEAQSQNERLSPEQRERAGLLREAEYHSYRAEQYDRIIDGEQRLGRTEPDSFFVRDRDEHQEAANEAAARLHEFDQKHQLVNAHCVPVADQHRPEFAKAQGLEREPVAEKAQPEREQEQTKAQEVTAAPSPAPTRDDELTMSR